MLGQDVEQHMDTVVRLNAYSQQLRSERAGSGTPAHAQDGSTREAALNGFSAGSTVPVVNGGNVAAGPAYPAAAAAHAAAQSGHPAAGGHAAAPAPGPAAGQWHGHRQAVSSEIQPAPQLPVSWTPAAAASTAEAAAGGTGSRWSTGMAASPRQNGQQDYLLGCFNPATACNSCSAVPFCDSQNEIIVQDVVKRCAQSRFFCDKPTAPITGHTWQHEHAPGQPQMKPAVPHADVLFPIVFCLAIGGLCQLAGQLLPFWLLLVLLLPSFVYGVHLVVLKGDGCCISCTVHVWLIYMWFAGWQSASQLSRNPRAEAQARCESSVIFALQVVNPCLHCGQAAVSTQSACLRRASPAHWWRRWKCSASLCLPWWCSPASHTTELATSSPFAWARWRSFSTTGEPPPCLDDGIR